ncbi:MAG: organomercurial lyase [Acidimicrobiia bacterium]
MVRLLDRGLSDVAREIAAAGFVALWDGRAARPDELVPGSARRVRRATAELVDRGRAEVDDDGRVVGVHGLTLRETRHGFLHAGRLHRTWCAFDAVGIPAALQIAADARTTCPACGRAVHVPIRGGQPEVSDVALWLPSSTVRHLMADFCAAADLYCGRDHLGQRIDPARQPGEVLDLAGAAALGRTVWADIAALRLDGQSGR